MSPRLPQFALGVDPELLGEWLESFAPALVLYARQLCVSPEDVVQEAFVKLAGQGSRPENPAAWLYKVVRNGALTAARAERRRTRRESDAARQRAAWFEPASHERLDAERVCAALAELPSCEREIVTARLWGNLTFREIGEFVNLSDSAAQRRYVAALETLRIALSSHTRSESS